MSARLKWSIIMSTDTDYTRGECQMFDFLLYLYTRKLKKATNLIYPIHSSETLTL